MDYSFILDLREISDNVQRGYKFEQIVRELLPWDIKPPVSLAGDSEQLDAFFLWKNQAFIVESKAKKEEITAGSKDWEDFELKIRRRKRAVTGLFCSLYSVNQNVYERATDLNKEGYLVIVLEGGFWDELAKSMLSIIDVLDYMNYYGRAKFLALPPKLNIIEKWRFDKNIIIKKLSDVCIKHSSVMLNRYKSPYHDKTYITREIEKQIDSYVKEIKPNTLTKEKENPSQICLLRDFSGSGKTTTSIQISSTNDAFIGVGMTANEQDIDQKCFSFFESLGENYGVGELRALNKPIVYVIDSLDEASGITGKKKEIMSVLDKILDKLNKKANELGLLVYPILFVFTVREDYWRDWESIFEGRKKNVICKRLSCFNEGEFVSALNKYMDCYSYTIINDLSRESIEVLSRPINLQIFSETNQYAGQIIVDEVWESSVIYKYFERKLDDIYKRNIPNYKASAFMNLLSEIAYNIICSKLTVIDECEIVKLIETRYSLYSPFFEEILKVFLSEQILVKDIEKRNGFRFRHSRFLDFLMAYYCLSKIRREIYLFDSLLGIIFESKIVLMFHIHEDMFYICKQKYPDFIPKLDDYYSKNNLFMSHKISSLRCDLANNLRVSDNDISLVLKNVNGRNPELMMEAFMVIASKPCKQSDIDIINTFYHAFRSECNIPEQYKMIKKLSIHGLLVSEKVLSCILQSNYPKNWETYLGGIIETKEGDYNCFIDLWNQSKGEKALTNIIHQTPEEDWTHVRKLIDIIMSGKEYILGDV